jgi:hypothetical protein
MVQCETLGDSSLAWATHLATTFDDGVTRASFLAASTSATFLARFSALRFLNSLTVSTHAATSNSAN